MNKKSILQEILIYALFFIIIGIFSSEVEETQIGLLFHITFWLTGFFGFMIGTFVKTYTSSNGISNDVEGNAYRILWSFSLIFLIATLYMESIVGSITTLYWLFSIIGFRAHHRYLNGEQPYQKYDWWPKNPLLIPLTPYYYYKSKNESDSSQQNN